MEEKESKQAKLRVWEKQESQIKKTKVPVVKVGEGQIKTCALPLEALFSLSRPLLALPTWSLK